MRQASVAVILVGALALGASGCGIPKEQHQKTLDELKKAKADFEAEKKACDEAKAERDKRLTGLGDENKVMKAKLISLGENLSTMRTKAGMMVKDLTAKEKQIAELVKAQEAARKRAEVFQSLLQKFKSMIDAGKLNVKIRQGRMIVQMSDKILFSPGQDKIKTEGESALEQVAQVLISIRGRAFQVAGHTDNIPIRTRRFKSNWELSTSRAVNVVKFMITKGMDPKMLSAAGYGPFDPVGDNAVDEGRQANRRIEITLMPSLDDLPGFSS
jgi:chemotaxis protein MotB